MSYYLDTSSFVTRIEELNSFLDSNPVSSDA